MVEDRDAQLFAVQGAGVVHPGTALAPHILLFFGTIRARHGTRGFFFKSAHETQRKDPFLGVAKDAFLDRGKCDVEIEAANSSIVRVEGHGARFREQALAVAVDPVLQRRNGA